MGEKRSRPYDGRDYCDGSDLKRQKSNDVSKLDARFPPSRSQQPSIPPYSATKPLNSQKSNGLPQLPPISDSKLAAAVFTHTSARSYDVAAVKDDSTTYEPLEFLGDAYIEVIATRILHSRFSHFNTGKKAQTREALVNNKTLAEFARGYGFDKPGVIKHFGDEAESAKDRWIKILGDVMEAYVGAVVESDPQNGFKAAEEWLTALWAPKLLALADEAKPILNVSDLKTKLNTWLMNATAGTKIEFADYQPKQTFRETGKCKYFREVRFTGWGHEKKLLGRGEAWNIKQADAEAIQDAFHQNMPLIVAANATKKDYERKRKEEKERDHA